MGGTTEGHRDASGTKTGTPISTQTQSAGATMTLSGVVSAGCARGNTTKLMVARTAWAPTRSRARLGVRPRLQPSGCLSTRWSTTRAPRVATMEGLLGAFGTKMVTHTSTRMRLDGATMTPSGVVSAGFAFKGSTGVASYYKLPDRQKIVW